MKFIKTLLVVLLLMASALLLIGVFVPEVDDEFDVKVEQPVMSVFANLMDVQSAPEWVGGLDHVERVSGFLAMPGSEFKLFYSGTETETVYMLEVLEVIPLETVRFRLYNDMLEVVVSVKFREEGLATIMETYVQIKGRDLLSRAFVPLMKNTIVDVGKENFETFKQLQEQ